MVERDVFESINDGDQLNENFFNNMGDSWVKTLIPTGSIGRGLIKWSATRFQSSTDESDDSGVTWSGDGYGDSGNGIADTSGASGIQTNITDGTSTFTTDSGAVWGASSVDPPNSTTINSISMGSTLVGIMGGDSASGNAIWVTGDGGDNWAQATTGPTAEVKAVVMASASVGYAVDVNQNIWKTTNAGVDWSDTGDNFTVGGMGTATIGGRLLAVDVDTILFNNTRVPEIQHYVNSTNTITTLIDFDANFDNLNDAPTNWVLATDGNYYCAWNNTDGTANGPNSVVLFRYDESIISQRSVGWSKQLVATNSWRTNDAALPVMIEVNNLLYVNMGGQINIYRVG